MCCVGLGYYIFYSLNTHLLRVDEKKKFLAWVGISWQVIHFFTGWYHHSSLNRLESFFSDLGKCCCLVMWGLFFVFFWFGCLGGEVGVGLHYFHIFMLEGYETNGLLRGSSFFFCFLFSFSFPPFPFPFLVFMGFLVSNVIAEMNRRGVIRSFMYFFFFFADIVLCNWTVEYSAF